MVFIIFNENLFTAVLIRPFNWKVETTLSVSGHFRTRSITLDTRERLETIRYFKSWSLPRVGF